MAADTLTVVFTDLRESTARRVAMGDDAFDELRRRHDEAIGAVVSEHGGTIVKFTGDGVLATFAGSSSAVAASVGVQQALTSFGLAVGIGASAGDVVVDADDVHGTPVVEAARLCAVATAGQVVVADVVRVLAGSRGGHRFQPLGPLTLKGLTEPVVAHAVAWEPAASPTRRSRPRELETRGAIPFVGRTDEAERVRAAWCRVRGGEIGVVFVAGEPGIGKTRLVAEFVDELDDEALVLFGHCEESSGLPYQPFARAVGDLLVGLDEAVLARLPAAMASELLALVPSLAIRHPDANPPLRSDPDGDRFRLFDAVAGLIDRFSHDQPVLLVLDDLHWADRPSLLLLRHLLRSPLRATMVLATYRDTDLDRTHPLAGMLADLRRVEGQVNERVVLRGVGEDDVAALLGRMGGQVVDDQTLSLARTLHSETEGNPFFVGEVVRHLVESGAIAHDGERWRVTASLEDVGIPEGVREAVGRRLSSLDEVTNELLSIAAVAGARFDVGVVAAAAERSVDETLDALDVAAQRRLIQPGDDGLDYAFTHALVRTTLLSEVSPPRLMRWHRSLARALEARSGGARAVDLARHFCACVALGEHLPAIRYLAQTGAEARASLAFEEAARHYADALELADLFDVPDRDRVPLMIGQGEALRWTGDPEARTVLLAAADRAGDDGVVLADIVLALSTVGVMSTFAGDDQDVVGLCERALVHLPDDEVGRRARVSAVAAVELALGSTLESDERSRRHAAVALDLARRADPASEGFVLSSFYGMAHNHETFDELPRVGARLVEIGEQTGDGRLLGAGLGATAFALFERGRLRAGIDALVRLEAVANASRLTFEMFRAPAIATAVQCLELDDATAFDRDYERALTAAQRAGVHESMTTAVAVSHANVRYLVTGAGSPADPAIAELLADLAPSVPTWPLTTAFLLHSLGDPAGAEPWYQRFRAIERWPANFMWLATAIAAANMSGRLDHLDDLSGYVVLLEPLAGRTAFGGVLTVGPVDLALAEAYARLGRIDDALVAWRRARDHVRSEGLLRWELDAHVVLWSLLADALGAEREQLAAECREIVARGRTGGFHRLCDRVDEVLADR